VRGRFGLMRGDNFYRVMELAPSHRDVEIAGLLGLSRERVRQLRVMGSFGERWDHGVQVGERECGRCGRLFMPISKYRTTCGCRA
jgi:ribosomal protein S27AE